MPLIYKHNPDIFMRPSYRISPFSTMDISIAAGNHYDSNSNNIISNFFGDYDYRLTDSGRAAIEIALIDIGVIITSTVTILTTSNNYYVSSCVTTAIEKHCKWNRSIGPDTSVIFVIHEFGCLYKSVNSLKEYNVPIIEDFAHSFASNLEPTNGDNAKRYVGDYAIFSFPKFIPVQFGGAIVSTKNKLKRYYVDEKINNYLSSAMVRSLKQIDEIISQRKSIYNVLITSFAKLGGVPYFNYLETEVPGAFLFKVKFSQDVLHKMKIFTQSHGIESSVFYGDNAFFIPCHQRLSCFDVDYFHEIIKQFIEEI